MQKISFIKKLTRTRLTAEEGSGQFVGRLLMSTCSFYLLPNTVFITTYLIPYLPSGPVQSYQLHESISKFRGVWCTFLFLYTRTAASNLGLHCLPMSQKWDPRFIWVKDVWGYFVWCGRLGEGVAALKQT